jgi:hypothetical protein
MTVIGCQAFDASPHPHPFGREVGVKLIMLENGVCGKIFCFLYKILLQWSGSVTVMFHRYCWCEAVMLPLRSHLHGSYILLAAGWYSLDGHVMAPVCVCVQLGIQEEGGHRGCR